MNGVRGSDQQLMNHPWVKTAQASPAGMLLQLSADGVNALRRHGRQPVLDALQTHLTDAACALPPVWRLLDDLPAHLAPPSIEQALAQPRPSRAIVLGESETAGRWTLTLQLPLELVQFDGHFATAPVLPGVVQIGWALAEAAPRLGTSRHCREMEVLKFQHLLHPGDRVALSLWFAAAADDDRRGKLHFSYHLDGRHCASGRLLVERDHG